MANPARKIDTFYSEHIRPLSAVDRIYLLALLAREVAQEAGPLSSDKGDVPVEAGEGCLQVEDGVLVLAGALEGAIPDHRQLREERLDYLVGTTR